MMKKISIPEKGTVGNAQDATDSYKSKADMFNPSKCMRAFSYD